MKKHLFELEHVTVLLLFIKIVVPSLFVVECFARVFYEFAVPDDVSNCVGALPAALMFCKTPDGSERKS